MMIPPLHFTARFKIYTTSDMVQAMICVWKRHRELEKKVGRTLVGSIIIVTIQARHEPCLSLCAKVSEDGANPFSSEGNLVKATHEHFETHRHFVKA